MKLKSIYKIAGLENKHVRRMSFGLMSVLLLHSLLIPLLPLPGKILLDRLQKSQSVRTGSINHLRNWFSTIDTMDLLIICSIAVASLGLLIATLRYLEGILAAVLNKTIFVDLRKKLNQSILDSSLPYLNKKRKMDLVGRVSTDVEKVQQIYGGAYSTLFRAVPTILWTIIMMIWVNALVATIFLITIPVFYFGTYYLTQVLKSKNRKLRDAGNSLQETLLDTFSHFSILKSLRGENKALKRLEESNDHYVQAFIEAENVASFFYASLILVKAFIRTLVLLVGFYFILQNKITLGDFFLFFSYLESLIYPVDEISRFGSKWTKTLVAIERIETLLDENEQATENTGKVIPQTGNLGLQISNLQFSYKSKEDPIFNDLSTELSKTGFYALVGASGSGKSTFMGLLNRLYTPEGGEVRFSNHLLADLDLDHLRKNVVYVSQDNYLFKGSVRENLCFNGQEKTETEIYQALEAVNAREFVERMPHGLETDIGEAGKGLSGGQSRRLCLARAFLTDEAKVFLFDEPTSGLDEHSAKVVIDSLRKLSDQRIVLFSTHRLDEIKFTDSIFSLDRGQFRIVTSLHELREATSPLVPSENKDWSETGKPQDIFGNAEALRL